MLADPDESIATENQIGIILLKMMEMLLSPFYQIGRYCEQLTPLKLQRKLKTIQQVSRCILPQEAMPALKEVRLS